MVHGGTARVLRPADESPELQEELEQALFDRLQPRTGDDRHLVRGLVGDLLRATRVSRAEAAARELALQQASRRLPVDNKTLVAIAKQKPLWRHLRRTAEHGLAQLSDRGNRISAINELGLVAKLVPELMSNLAEIMDTSVEPAEELLERATDLDLTYHLAESRAQALIAIADMGISYLNNLRARIVQDEADRMDAEGELATIPDAATTTRLSRYASAAQNAALKKVQLLKGLRELDLLAEGGR